jgi:hydroxyethylthiazole kinase
MIDAYSVLERIRTQQPVVHHLTNWVTIYDCAQIVKVMGGSPVMAHAAGEVEDMVAIASSLVLNIGTLTPSFVEAMLQAARRANARGIPVVLDVCGAGATPLRDDSSTRLISEVRIDVIKGNASEIARVCGACVRTKGVDASDVAGTPVLAVKLALERRCVVVATGKEDIVTDGKKTLYVANGDLLMTRVVGTGCMAASVIGACAAVETDLLTAAAAGLVIFEVAAEQAAHEAHAPMSFKARLFDELYALDRGTIDRVQQVRT